MSDFADMRKLFGYWSGRTVEARHREIAESLEKYWLEWLEEILWVVNPRVIEAHGRDPVSALRSLSARDLLALDEACRTRIFYLRRGSLGRSSVRIDDGDDAITDAYLFVVSCAPSGVVREQAIMAFARYPGALAVAAGLIRSTDWVAEVRAVAVSLARSFLPRVPLHELARTLELALRLKERSRANQDLWQSVVEPRLRATESRDILWAIARQPTGSRLLRRSAFEYLMQGEPAGISGVLAEALANSDPRFGLWVVAKSEGLLQSDERERFLHAALNARHAAVRREALRRFGATHPGDYVQKLRDALFDPARGVRTFAAFELNRTCGEHALSIWRAAAGGGDDRRSELAWRALCDSGERQDVEQIATDGVERNADFRAAILRGLARTGSTYLQSHLVAALQDPSALMIRQVSEICRRGAASLDVGNLETALTHADEHRAVHLIRLSAALVSKWDRLEFLLRATSRDNTEQAECAAQLVDRWTRAAGRSFVAPSDQQVQRLIQLSKDAEARYPKRKRLWREIEVSLAAFK